MTLPGNGTSLFVPPAQKTFNFNRVLPNAGFTLSPFGPMHQFYMDVASSLAAPRTDNLYNGGSNGLCATPTTAGCVFSSFENVQPETSTNYDIGYRFTSDTVTGSLTGYNTQFKNRIVSSFDQNLGISVDRNIGSVNVAGVDGEINVQLDAGPFGLYLGVLRTQPGLRDTACDHPAQRHRCAAEPGGQAAGGDAGMDHLAAL